MIVSTNAEKHVPMGIMGMLMVQMGMASQVYISKFIKLYTLNKYNFLYVPSGLNRVELFVVNLQKSNTFSLLKKKPHSMNQK